MVDFVQRQLGLRRLARLTGPIAVRGDVGNSQADLDGIRLVGEITFVVGVVDDPDTPIMFLETLNFVSIRRTGSGVGGRPPLLDCPPARCPRSTSTHSPGR